MNAANLQQQVDANTRLFREVLERASPKALQNHQTNGASWSIAQVLRHLVLVNESYYPMFRGLLDKTYKPPFHARFKFLVRYFGKLIIEAVEPERRKKMKTFPVWQSESFPDATLEDFIRSQEELKEHLNNLAALLTTNPVINSPASRVVVYSLQDALTIILNHQQRHLNQIKEMLDV